MVTSHRRQSTVVLPMPLGRNKYILDPFTNAYTVYRSKSSPLSFLLPWQTRVVHPQVHQPLCYAILEAYSLDFEVFRNGNMRVFRPRGVC